MNVDDVLENSVRHDRKPRPKHPKGWEPGVELGADSGVLVVDPRPVDEGEQINPDAEPWDSHLREAGLDPAEVEVVPPVEVRTWDAMIKNQFTQEMVVRKMVYFRARIIRRDRFQFDEQLRDWVRKWKPRKARQDPVGDRSLVVVWSDPQIGKDDGDGTRGTVHRWTNSHGMVQDRWRELRKAGVALDRIMVASLGDIVEGCSGHYAQQSYRVQLNEREQRRTARLCIVAGLKAFSDVAPVVDVLPVGGNHGEVRSGGQSFTDFADNVDVAVYEDAADLLAENDRFDNIKFHIPRSDLTQTIDLHGTIVGLAHGHQARGGGKPAQKIEAWWQGQMKGRQPVGDADILLTGHYHHLIVQQVGPRTHMQAPALDGGSEWWVNISGLDSPAGVLTFTVGEDGWDHLKVLPAPRDQ